MEVAFFVIAVIGLLALSAGGFGGTAPSAVPPVPTTLIPQAGPTGTWTPTPAGSSSVPMTPSTQANVGAPLLSGSAAIGTSSLGVMGVSTAAVPIVGAAIGATVAVVSALLAAHQQRLKGALNENHAIDLYIPVFDSFVAALVAAWNSGQGTAMEVANAAQQFDRYIYNAYKSLVGAPGTAWNDSVGMTGQCNASCTAGCCVYFGDLGPVLNNISYVLGYPTGKWGAGDPRISGRTITAPKVYPSKYSTFTRPLYSFTLK